MNIVWIHSGDKKNVNLEHYKEFRGFEQEIREANAKYRSKKLDDDKFAVEANAEKLREEVEKSGNLLTTDQKKAYLEQREKDFPDIPLNQDEQFLIYGDKISIKAINRFKNFRIFITIKP